MQADWERAVLANDATTVRQMIEAGADIDARDAHGQTALMLAAHHGHRATVETLLRRGAALDVTAKYGLTALMLAVVAGHEAIARRVAEAGADLNVRGTGAPGFAGKSAADLAAARGETNLAHALRPAARDAADESTRILRIDRAFKAGHLDALRAAVEDPSVVPNGPMPLAIGSCLEYAIYHSPVSFIRTLLELGADTKPVDHAGFPPLIAALSCSRDAPGSPARPDVTEILELLLDHGADPHQRGINDYTALHMAVAEDNVPAVRLLLARGADPSIRTRIDDCETPLEMAERAGLLVIADLLRAPAR